MTRSIMACFKNQPGHTDFKRVHRVLLRSWCEKVMETVRFGGLVLIRLLCALFSLTFWSFILP